MANILENILNRKSKNGNEGSLTTAVPYINSEEYTRGNMNDLGYTRAGRNNGDPIALNNSFQLIRSGQIVDENNNEQKRNEVIESLDSKISEHKAEINKHKAAIDKTDQVDLPLIEREITENKLRIEELKSNSLEIRYKRNRFNLILTWIGFVIGFIYLYIFYVSAIHSALFRDIASEVARAGSNSIGSLLNNVFNVTAFKEFNIHWFAPVVFFIFALIFHFALEIKSTTVKWASTAVVASFVLVADGLLAYCIENNNHTLSRLMGLSDGTWVFYKSFVFYLVLFFGFFTSMGWSIVLHKLASEFEASNPEMRAREEILGIEKIIRQLYAGKGIAASGRIERLASISSLEDKINELEAKKSNVHYSLVDLEKSIDDFYNGWLSYLNGLKSDLHIKQECERLYISFKSTYFNRSLTA
jgi:peptidoglycan hydrolase CwlO-like protein